MTEGPRHSTLWCGEAPLILASRSAARRAILLGAGIPFEAIPADIDERQLETQLRQNHALPDGVARALAEAKARTVSGDNPDRLVLGADQVLALGDRIFAKPETRAGAGEQLALLSGKTHTLYSALALYRARQCLFAAETAARMTMRQLSAGFIAQYLDAVGDAVCASVGCYQIEGLGAHLFEAIEGDYWTILGLPIIPLLAFLREQGNLAA